MEKKFKYIYGPVPSWRLGSSLGIDLLSREEKICNFNCIYCQLGATIKYTLERKVYVPVEKIIEELESLPDIKIDYITFSGRGEPTLAENLGEAIKAIKTIRKEKVAVLTNASLIDKKEVRKELALADFVVAKLDAYSQESLQQINNPIQCIESVNILDGVRKFRKEYKRKLALQMMFIEENEANVNNLVCLTNLIKPDEVQVNTPLRRCDIKPLTNDEIIKIRAYFVSACKGINIVSVYDEIAPKAIVPISDEDTLKRRGKIK